MNPSLTPEHEIRLARSRTARALWTSLGTLLLAIGVIGIALPFLPTTPFLLLAAACYIRGSPRMYRWMMTNKYFGRQLKDYSEGRGISKRAKVAAVAFLWAVLGITALLATENLIVRIVLLVVGVGVTIHLATLKTKERGEATPH